MKSLSKLLRRLYAKETKETLWSLAAKGLAAALFFLLNIYLARVLEVELFGTWSFLLSVLTIVFLISYLGLNNATRVFAAMHSGTTAIKPLLSRSLALRLAISTLAALLFVLLHEHIAGWIRRPDLAGPLLFATPLIFLSGLVEYFKQVTVGLHRLKYHFVINLFEFGLKIVFCFWLLNLVVSLQNVILGHWLALLVASLAGFYIWLLYYRRSDSLPLAVPGAAPGSGQILRYSLPLFLISIGFLLITEIDTLMLGILADDYQVGLFAVGKQLANKLPQLSLALAMGSMQSFARLTPENLAEMRNKFRALMRLNLAIFLPLGAGIILLSPWLVPLLLGAAYQDAVLPLQILTLWVVMSAINIFHNHLLDYQGKANQRAINFTLTMIATILLNVLLIPRFGAVGAAFSTTLAYIPYFGLNWLETRKILGG